MFKKAKHEVIMYVDGTGFVKVPLRGYEFDSFGRAFFMYMHASTWCVADIQSGRPLHGYGKTRRMALERFERIYSNPAYRFWEMDNYGSSVEQFEKLFTA